MKAKLIKDNDGYWLDISDDGITKRPLTDFGQLSIKNCEAIANGYDLDELAKNRYPIENTGAMFMPNRHEVTNIYRQEGFIEGAKTILEILGDKKFSELDMRIAYDAGASNIDGDGDPIDDVDMDFEGIIHSAQQTEWDVEIDVLMTEREGGVVIETPKLDADGCLILKRI